MPATRKVISSILHYRELYNRRSAEELRTISHIKRFLELLVGDGPFRQRLADNCEQAQRIVKDSGIDVDVYQFAPIWKGGLRIRVPKEELADYPLAQMWSEWISDLVTFRNLMREDGDSGIPDPRFSAWRKRQMERVRSELGEARANAIVHSLFSYELSKGCSMGCWFCGLSADSFKGYYQYNEKNAGLWREILQVAADMLGPAAQTGFCYWATEPADNPDYLDFLEDYQAILGVIPQTTSAAPLRNLPWTRELMALQKKYLAAPSRFSILSLRVLQGIHEAFTPEELLGFELVLQNKGSVLSKARAGKVFQRAKEESDAQPGLGIAPGLGSIACVSGFLVNMMDGTIQLVSPGRATDSNPLGYRVHLAGSFSNGNDFGDFIQRAIDECMPSSLPPHQTVGFREDLTYIPGEKGFSVQSSFCSHTFTGHGWTGDLGHLVADGTRTATEIMGILIDTGADIFGAGGTMQELFDKGLLDDQPKSNGEGAG